MALISPSQWLNEQLDTTAEEHKKKLEESGCPEGLKSSMQNSFMSGYVKAISLLLEEELKSIPGGSQQKESNDASIK